MKFKDTQYFVNRIEILNEWFLGEQCTNSLTPRNIDDQFSVEIPSKAADVLLLVSTDKDNEVLYNEYAQSLMTAITDEFKAKGIE